MDFSSLHSEEDPLGSSMKLTHLFMNADPDTQDEIQQAWNRDLRWSFPHALELPKQDAEFSVRDRAFACLMYLIIASPWSDPRDYIMSVAIVYHGVRLSGHDADQVLSDFASRTHGQISDLVRSFVSRDETNKSMKAFCLEPVQDSEGHVIGLRMLPGHESPT